MFVSSPFSVPIVPYCLLKGLLSPKHVSFPLSLVLLCFFSSADDVALNTTYP